MQYHTTAKHKIQMAIAIATIACLASCAPQSPLGAQSGTVTVISYYETTSGDTTACIITMKIVNTGTAKIESSMISYSVQTASRTYQQSIAYAIDILPGKSIFVNPSLAYAISTETTNLQNISIIDVFFE